MEWDACDRTSVAVAAVVAEVYAVEAPSVFSELAAAAVASAVGAVYGGQVAAAGPADADAAAAQESPPGLPVLQF